MESAGKGRFTGQSEEKRTPPPDRIARFVLILLKYSITIHLSLHCIIIVIIISTIAVAADALCPPFPE